MIEEFKPEINGTGLRIGIVKARFNENIGEGLFNACVKVILWLPAKLCLKLCRVDGVTSVVARTVCYEFNEALRLI